MKKCAFQQWEDYRTIFCASTNDPWKMNKSTAVLYNVTYQSPRFLVSYCVFTSTFFNTKLLKLQNKVFILPTKFVALGKRQMYSCLLNWAHGWNAKFQFTV